MRARPAEDATLLARLDGGFARIAAQAGAALACRPGCDSCCRRLFPVTRLDALRLREGLVEAPRREAIEARARAQRARLPATLLAAPLTASEAELDRLFEAAEESCPVLDPESGRCELYDHRPAACRTFGPPLSYSAPCELCFVDASRQTIEAHRWDPDPDDLERRLLDRIGTPSDEAWYALISVALEEA